MWKSWIVFILGLWLIISGFITSLNDPANMLIIGVLVAAFGFWDYQMWQGIVNAILGVWIFLSGSVFDLANLPNMFIIGVIIAILSLWSASQQRRGLVTHKTA